METLPEWMLTDNNYSPQKDRNGYFTKSILNFFKLFRHFQLNKIHSASNVSTATSTTRLIMTVGLIILVSLSNHLFFIGSVTAFLLVTVSIKPIDILKSVIFSGIIAAFFTALIIMPSYFIYKTNTVIILPIKVFLTVGLLSLYAKSTPWNKITASLRLFKLPVSIIFLIDLTLQYILILGNIAFEMLQALKLRSIGKNQNKQKSFSGISGTLFLKSIELSKETQQAMECRLFTGEYITNKNKIKLKDFLPLLILILFIGLYIFINLNGNK